MEKNLQNIDKILAIKQAYLAKLTYLSLDSLTQTNARHIQLLENEIGAFIECKETINNLKIAYVSATIRNADLLIFLDCQNWALKNENRQLRLENTDLKHHSQYLDNLSDTLLKFIHKSRKEVRHD
ncbi:hypothetical protein [Emticicia agri]|uniref:Uncharacterized protein n=1 Tax=Emticicia agri TaxID=2492393 RepID=A0A4Q5LVP2_9BACT|nr:hypothetical protein [Emticicia agri]RYU93752.1 hypothetical protein EWM59_20295 [Emticicia agri]